jgi:Nif-specific regulatory protein
MPKKGKTAGKGSSEDHEDEMLNILLEVSQSLYQYLNIDDLIQHIIRLIRKLMNAEAVSVILHDEKNDEFVFRWLQDERTAAETRLKSMHFPIDQGIAGSVFASGKPEMILNIADDSRHFKDIDQLTRSKTRSMIAVPLDKKKKTIGVLEALNKKGGVFNEKDLDLLLTIAPIIAMALDNARMYAELEGDVKELQVSVKQKSHLIKNTQEENIRLRKAIEQRYRFDQIIGNSDAMLEVFRLCEKIMKSDITVLIEGETGTGKELIARCIHFNNPRKGNAFVSQNCGGIPETLLASELFGHKRGAFTGAIADKKGLFESAHGGTIFLDEVAEMSPTMQTSLLRALQEGEIKALGADRYKRVDVRIISATNKDLEDYVEKGEFREDLFYRLNVFAIKLPPLRERTGDIPILTNHFIDKYNKKHKRAVKGIHRLAMQCLEAHPFTGNVRELENEIERAIAMADDGKPIDISHLSQKIQKYSTGEGTQHRIQGSLKEMVETLERSVLTQMLKKHDGNKSKVARVIGLSRFGLTKKIQRYKL